MKSIRSLSLPAAFAFFVMGLMPTPGTAQSYTSPPTEFQISVPYGSEGNHMSNVVTVGSCMKLNKAVFVHFRAGNPANVVWEEVNIDEQVQIDLGGGGTAGAGRVIGTLSAYQQGSVVWVTYAGFISGYYSRGYQSKVTFSTEKPLTVCVLIE